MKDKRNSKLRRDRRKILSILSHCSIYFCPTIFAVCIPIALILLSEDDVIVGNAKEALNFYITGAILLVVFALLVFLAIGIPLLILLYIASWVMPVFAIVKIARQSDRVYRYPLIFHLI